MPKSTSLLLILILHLISTLSPCEGTSIAIIGAGFSGLSTAYHLVQAGYSDITIFEATRHIGGFATTYTYKNVTHDMGPYGLTPTFWKFHAAAESLGFKFCPFKAEVIIPGVNSTVIPQPQFAAMVDAPLLPDPSQYLTELRRQIARYTELWQELYGFSFRNQRLDTDRLFPKKPNNSTQLRLLSMPMIQFLRQEGLSLLITPLRAFTDTQAYGPMETTPVLYYFAWAAPSTLLSDSENTVPCGKNAGVEQIAKAMLASMTGKVSTRFGAFVRNVRRGRNGAVIITDDLSRERFDKVVVTAKLPKRYVRAPIVAPLSRKELKAWYTMEELEVYLALLEGKRGNTKGIEYGQVDGEALLGKDPNARFWYAKTDEKAELNGPFHSDPRTIVRMVARFFYRERAKGKLTRISGREKLRNSLADLRTWDATRWTPIRDISFRGYFQRWRPREVRKGFPWILQDIQGIGNVYFMNSATCGFESFGHLFDCADNLVKRPLLVVVTGTVSMEECVECSIH